MQNMNKLPSNFICTEPQVISQSVTQTPINASELFTQLANQTPQPICLAKGDYEYRFANVNCPADTAVTVKMGDETYYLHANTVKTSDGSVFIAAQAPHTDFARELYLKTALEHASVIVDLTNETDNKVGEPPVDGHYPKEVGEQQTFSSVTITLKDKKIDNESNINILRYHLFDAATGKEREITRINYQNWKDFHGSELRDLSTLISTVTQHANDSGYSHLSPMVNCRAGVGRTGTFITATTMHNLASQGKLGDDRIGILSSTILDARNQRGPLFVQTDAQLAILIEFSSQLENKSPIAEEITTQANLSKDYTIPPTSQFASLRSLQEPKFTPPAASPFKRALPSEMSLRKENLLTQEHHIVKSPTSTDIGSSEKITRTTLAMFKRPDIFASVKALEEQAAAQPNTLGVTAVRQHNVNILGVTATRLTNRVHVSKAKKAPEMLAETQTERAEATTKKAKSFSLFATLKRTATKISNFLFGK